MNLAMPPLFVLKLNFRNSLTKISLHNIIKFVENDFQFHQYAMIR